MTNESGTGIVHCAPAHGHEDYNLFTSQHLISPSSPSLTCHVDGLGQFSADVSDVVGEELAQQLVGKEVLGAGTTKMIEILDNIGVLKVESRIKHRYPYDWKTGKPVIVT